VVALKKYSLQGEELGDAHVSEALSGAVAHSQLVKDYITALRANVRKWTASTKTRAEVKHTTKKPSPQKGQGRARHGNLVAPQYRGGGRAFGPRPKFDVRLQVNRKERRMVVRALLAEKMREGKMIVVDSLEMDDPKTKVIGDLLKSKGLDRRVLVLGESSFIEIAGETNSQLSVCSLQHENLKKSVRNLPWAEFKLVSEVDGYTLAVAHNVVITQAALDELEEQLKKQK